MTISYWINENGNGGYFHGTLPDGAYSPDTCVLVPQKPSFAHVWDNANQQWIASLDAARNEIRIPRNSELLRTDKYLMSDYFSIFTQEQQEQIVTYRQELRDCPNKETIDEIVMPLCPDFIMK